MRVLVVENDPAGVAFLVEQLESMAPRPEIIVATNRDEALQSLDESFDVAVLDLRIPPTCDDPTAADSHGMAVFSEFASRFAHSPVILFTGFPSFDVSQQVLHTYARGRSACFGHSEHAGVYVIRKDNAAECLALLRTFNAELDQLETVEIDVGAVPLELGTDTRRILKVAARAFGAIRVEATQISGGLSGSKTLRCIARDEAARSRAVAIAKIGHASEMAVEEAAYNQHIVPILPSGTFANLMRRVNAGGTGHAGLFYRLAEGEAHGALLSLFKVIDQDSDLAINVVASLRELERGWTDETTARRPVLSDLRRDLISDADFQRLEPALYEQVRDVERRQILVRECTQHRDLHGENILVRPDGSPLLIDFGLVGVSIAGMDPTILELSLLTHSEGRRVSKGWPDAVAAASWPDVDAYVRDAPPNVARFVRHCRDWAAGVAGGFNPILACAFAYSTRQLKYPDVDHAAITAIIQVCRARLLRA